MFVRRSPAILLSLALSAAALVSAPSALAVDGGTAKDEPVKNTVSCSGSSNVKIRATVLDDGQIEVVGVVFSADDDLWSWKLKHNDDFSAMGEVQAKDADRSIRIVRTMVDLAGTDDIFFRAENQTTGEVCKLEVSV